MFFFSLRIFYSLLSRSFAVYFIFSSFRFNIRLISFIFFNLTSKSVIYGNLSKLANFMNVCERAHACKYMKWICDVRAKHTLKNQKEIYRRKRDNMVIKEANWKKLVRLKRRKRNPHETHSAAYSNEMDMNN